MDRTLHTLGRVRAVNESKGLVESIISSGDEARDEAVIEVAGWQLEAYLANPVILWSHLDESLPIARTTKLTKGKNALTAVAQFDMDDPEAVRILGKIARGFIGAASVRWLPLESEMRDVGEGRQVLFFTKSELLEWSFVSVPADSKALVIRSATGEPIDVRSFRPLADVVAEIERLLDRIAGRRQ